MIDLKKGIIDFGVIKVDGSTQRAEFENLSSNIVEKQTSQRTGSSLYIIKTPFIANGVSMRASIYYAGTEKTINEIELIPYGTEDCHQTFEASHKWLEEVLNTLVNADNEVILLKSDKMELYSAVIYTPRDGIETGGSIKITFK